jgi:hypothetical protein
MQWVVTRSYIRVDRVEKDLKRICIRFEKCKIFEHDQNVFSSVSYPKNPQELTRVTMQVELGRYGFNYVWTRVYTGGTGSIRF